MKPLLREPRSATGTRNFNHKVIKRRRGVGFGPQAHHTGVAERVVIEFQDLLVIELGDNVISDVLDFDLVPLLWIRFDVGRRQ